MNQQHLYVNILAKAYTEVHWRTSLIIDEAEFVAVFANLSVKKQKAS